jgi:hypothetical protein
MEPKGSFHGMCKACSMHGRDEKCIQNFGWKASEGDHLEELGIDGRMIL